MQHAIRGMQVLCACVRNRGRAYCKSISLLVVSCAYICQPRHLSLPPSKISLPRVGHPPPTPRLSNQRDPFFVYRGTSFVIGDAVDAAGATVGRDGRGRSRGSGGALQRVSRLRQRRGGVPKSHRGQAERPLALEQGDGLAPCCIYTCCYVFGQVLCVALSSLMCAAAWYCIYVVCCLFATLFPGTNGIWGGGAVCREKGSIFRLACKDSPGFCCHGAEGVCQRTAASDGDGG